VCVFTCFACQCVDSTVFVVFGFAVALRFGNQRLQRQFDGLLMMGIVMPETC